VIPYAGYDVPPGSRFGRALLFLLMAGDVEFEIGNRSVLLAPARMN
jgi:hypothetical protein